jgi:hypothetical protein
VIELHVNWRFLAVAREVGQVEQQVRRQHHRGRVLHEQVFARRHDLQEPTRTDGTRRQTRRSRAQTHGGDSDADNTGDM